MTNSEGAGSSGCIIEDQESSHQRRDRNTLHRAPARRVPRPDRQPGRHGQCRPLLSKPLVDTSLRHEGPRMGKKEALALMVELEGRLL